MDNKVKNIYKVAEGYYPNGQLRYKWEYLNDKRHGKQIGYWENGDEWYDFTFVNGRKKD